MNKLGPIIVIENDKDDKDILKDIFEELNYDNELIFFGNGVLALENLTTTDIQPNEKEISYLSTNFRL